MEKIKINELARDLDLASKDVIACLERYGVKGKKTMSTIELTDANLIFEYFTKKYDDGTDISVFFPLKKETMTEEVEQQEEQEAAKPGEEKEATLPDKDLPAQRVARHVDLRSNNVDLEKFDTEKIEKLVSDSDDNITKTQKIKKGPAKIQKKDAESLAKLQRQPVKAKIGPREIIIPEGVTVGELAEKMKLSATEIIKRLMLIGTLATINDPLDFDTASLISEDLGFKAEKEIIITKEDILFNDTEDASEDLRPRPPVVVVMGHVDHGKTSLLDAIRKTSVTSTEAGGITQHIGAYHVEAGGRVITFLDTPGHAAFTAMRSRGAQVTDIAILVVAADDGIMPQTVEAINHAKAAGVSIIIAINKIDKENANPDRVKQELTEHELVAEEWGGDTICVPVSAIKNEGIDLLLEMVLLVTDMKELKANPNRRAKGTVIESKLDKGRGPVATVLVQNGTLKTGDFIVAGTAIGRVRAMVDDTGKRVSTAGPSIPVEIVGLSEVPTGGDLFYAVDDERMAKSVVETRRQKEKDDIFSSRKNVTLDDLFSQINQGDVKTLNIIVKADVQGSVEAVKQSLEKLSNEEVKLHIIHGGVGAVNETDVMLADASNAIIVGFNVRPTVSAVEQAADKKVDVRLYRIIYEAIEEIEAAMKGMLTPKFKEVITGHAQVRQVYKITGVGSIGGCYITDGKISRNISVRIVRDGIVIHEGTLCSLKRFKDDAKDVAEGYECGIGIEKFNDIKEGDVIEGFIMEEIER